MLYLPAMTDGVGSGTVARRARAVISSPSVPFGHDPRALAVRRVAAIMIEHLDGLSVRSASEIWNRELEFRDSLSGPDRLYAPCRTTIGAALDSLVCGRLDDERMAEVRALGKAASEQGMPLEVVLRGLRVDFLVLWSEMLLVARTTDPTTQQSLINASEIVWGAVDGVTVQFTIGYRSNHEARVQAEAARREELAQRVLRGEPVAPTDISERFGFEAGDDLVVVVVDARGRVGADDLARSIRHASMHSVWARRGDEIAGLVAIRSERPAAVHAALGGLPGIRAGVARRCRGIAEVPAAVTEAGLALASMRFGAHGVASVFDDPLAVLVAAEPALATLMLREVLGPLLERPERERDMLLDTLVAFDDCDASVPAVAERVFCHRNTVLNRLTKITRLTGISFTAPSGVALVALAARAIRAGLLLADEPA